MRFSMATPKNKSGGPGGLAAMGSFSGTAPRIGQIGISPPPPRLFLMAQTCVRTRIEVDYKGQGRRNQDRGRRDRGSYYRPTNRLPYLPQRDLDRPGLKHASKHQRRESGLGPEVAAPRLPHLPQITIHDQDEYEELRDPTPEESEVQECCGHCIFSLSGSV